MPLLRLRDIPGPQALAEAQVQLQLTCPLLVGLFVEAVFHVTQAGIELALLLMRTLNSSIFPGLQL